MLKRLIFSLAFILSFNLYAANNKIYVIKINTSINPGTGGYIIEAIKKANADDVKLLVIELDTPGGLVETTRLIVQEMLSSKVPVAVNVTPPGAHAGSAGVMITLASHIAAMAPSTNIGAAHPVNMTPTGINGTEKKNENEKDTMNEKIVNDISAFVEGIAKARKRNFKWAIESVQKSSSITADDALKNNVIDFIAQDTNDLIKKADGFKVTFIDGSTKKLDLKGAVVEEVKSSFKLRLIAFIADPNLAYLLMMLAALGIYLELSHPGLILPGVVGGLAGILAIMSFNMLPITATGVILVLAGLLLIGLEFFVTAHGVLGGGGTVALVLGGIFLVDPSKTDMSVSYSVLLPVGILFGLAVVLIAYFVLRVRRSPAQTGYEGMIGLKAKVVAYNKNTKEGRLQIRGELWSFIPADKNVEINAGDEVFLKNMEGMTFIVEKK